MNIGKKGFHRGKKQINKRSLKETENLDWLKSFNSLVGVENDNVVVFETSLINKGVLDSIKIQKTIGEGLKNLKEKNYRTLEELRVKRAEYI
jgi:hypothetical protein